MGRSRRAGTLSVDDEALDRLSSAVKSIESRSSAEIVVVIHPSSGDYPHAPLLVAGAAGLAMLSFLLWSPWGFALVWFVVLPVAAGGLGAVTCALIPSLRRLLTPPAWRRVQVRRAASAAFLERRVHTTSRRTGVLVYVSLLERAVELVPDIAVEPLAQRREWHEARAAIGEAVRHGAPAAAVADAVHGLGVLLGAALPRTPDDVDELPNEVVRP